MTSAKLRNTRSRSARRIAVAAVAVATLAGGTMLAAWLATPDVARLATQPPAMTSYMRLRHTVKTSNSREGHAPAWRPISELAPALVCAVVKAEDRRFFLHHGIELDATWRAAGRYIRGEAGGGGSTITQQLARNIYLSPARSPMRKLREFLIAHRLESTLGKQRILELYLNVVEWGNGVWGAESAAHEYFGIGADQVNVFEATFMAAMLAAPSKPPTGNNGDRAFRVQHRVVRQLEKARLITKAEADNALAASDEWYSAVEDGVPWRDALARAAALYRASDATEATHVHPPAVLMRTCGYEAELAADN